MNKKTSFGVNQYLHPTNLLETHPKKENQQSRKTTEIKATFI
jgi:hypothetical protein